MKMYFLDFLRKRFLNHPAESLRCPVKNVRPITPYIFHIPAMQVSFMVWKSVTIRYRFFPECKVPPVGQSVSHPDSVPQDVLR